MRSLVVQTSSLGEVVLTTPLLAALAARGPVDVLVAPAAAPLLAHAPDVRRVLVFDKRGADQGMGGLRRLAARLRADGYDAAYLPQGSARSAALAWLARVPRRIGFASAAGQAFYTDRVPWRADRHHVERLWSLAFPDGAPEPTPEQLRPRLQPGPEDVAAVDALLAPHRAGGPLVAFAPGSMWATKRWPLYPALAARLAPGVRLAIIGASADRSLGTAIAETARIAGGTVVIDATGRLSLLASAELVRRSQVLVTNDSAPQHLASAVGTPTVTLFGPTVPEFGFGPLAPDSVAVGQDRLACRPCASQAPARCPLTHWQCMRGLDVDRVIEPTLRLLAAPLSRS